MSWKSWDAWDPWEASVASLVPPGRLEVWGAGGGGRCEGNQLQLLRESWDSLGLLGLPGTSWDSWDILELPN